MNLRLLVLLPLLAQADPGPDRSPMDLALSPDAGWAVTANATSDTVSLVDLSAGKVVAEVPVGKRPFAVALSGKLAVVTNTLSDSITLLEVDPPKLSALATIPVGDEPRGVAISKDGAKAIVALAGEDAVVAIDLKERKAAARASSGDEPWHVALTPDGARLAVSNTLSMTVSVHDASTLERLYAVAMRGHNLRRLAVSPDGQWAYVANIAERGSPTSKDNIDRGWVVGNRFSQVPLRSEGPREAITLDVRGKAVGDLDGVAVSPDGNRIAVTAGGTHELLLLSLPLPFVAFGGPGDHIEPALLRDKEKFRRIALGGRPLGVSFTPDGARLVVANYLSNAVQIVDVASGTVSKTVPLGGPAEPSLARRGETVFYDASRSFNQWYSCHSCHVEGHTNGATFDTLNDGKYGNLKKTLSLRGVTKTGPWTWHGWQKDLKTSLAHSMKTTMQGPEPSTADVEALAAFVATLDYAPPLEGGEAAKRGKAVFFAKGCDTCHSGDDYTSDEAYVVGLEAAGDAYKGFNPPSLRGVGRRNPYLHDGRARTLEDVLQKHHRPSKLGGQPDPTAEELADLIAFLRSL